MADTRFVDDKDRYRLNPTALNSLIKHFLNTVEPDAQTVSMPIGDRGASIQYHVIKQPAVTFYLFDMTKDSSDRLVEPDLQSIGDVIRVFCERQHDLARDVSAAGAAVRQVLLLPLRMCRGYFKIQPDYLPKAFHVRRKHAVLVELDINARELQVHDSQGVLRWLAYAGIDEKVQSEYVEHCRYHTYGNQGTWMADDAVSCGYFVYEYIKHIIRTGSSEGCEKITFNIMNECGSMSEYLEREKVALNKADDWASISGDLEPFEITGAADGTLDLVKVGETAKDEGDDGWVLVERDSVDQSGWLASIMNYLRLAPAVSRLPSFSVSGFFGRSNPVVQSSQEAAPAIMWRSDQSGVSIDFNYLKK